MTISELGRYPDNMDAVFTVLNNLGTGSSNHYDEEVARGFHPACQRQRETSAIHGTCRHACASWACRLPGTQSFHAHEQRGWLSIQRKVVFLPDGWPLARHFSISPASRWTRLVLSRYVLKATHS